MNCPKFLKKSAGFTLIELLVVIGILAILLSIVLIAINPARQFGQANDTKRRSDIEQILNAVGASAADNKGTLPAGMPAAGAAAVDAAAVCAAVMPTYIPAFPQDPTSNNGAPITNCTGATSGYMISVDAQGRVTVSAPNAQQAPAGISITR